MPQIARHYCSRCGTSIFNCIINGRRVPFVFYMVVAQPDDTGPGAGANDDGVMVPSFIRALMSLPTPRVELCMRCVAEVFAQPPLLPENDPVADLAGSRVPGLLRQTVDMDRTSQAQVVTAHVYDALAHGQQLAAGKPVAVAASSLPVAPAIGSAVGS